MKVIPYPVLPNRTERDYDLNYLTLNFRNRQTEVNFIRALSKTFKTHTLKCRFTTIHPFHLMLLLLYLIAYLLQLHNETLNNTMIFQIVLIISCLITTSISFFIRSRGMAKLLYKDWLLYATYLSTSIILILNDSDFQNITFSNSNILDLPSLPGLIAICLYYNSGILSSYALLFVSNILILASFALFRFMNSEGFTRPMLEVILLGISQIYQMVSIYISELEERKKFVEQHLVLSGENEKMVNSVENDRPDFKVQDCIEELTCLLPLIQDNLKYPIEKTISCLKNISSEYRTRMNSDVNIEAITKNLDDEDKIYIQQSWSTNQILNVRKKRKLRMSIVENKVISKNFDLDAVVILKQIGVNWNVNIIDLNNRTTNSPITAAGKYVMNLYNLYEAFNIDEKTASNFFLRLEKNYKPNPYHNAMHATDILASGLYIISNSFMSSSLSELEILIVIVSHLAHDVGHPGFTNRFLINFQDKLAMQCNL